MSRSALWHQRGNVKGREEQAIEIFDNAIEEGRQNSYLKGIIPLIGSADTFNLHPVLLQNISKSPYFQKCCEKLKDWNSLVDEIYYEVKHMEPWSQGGHKSPSTAFCLLLRLFTLRCTSKQMTLMLDHVDSPYIRCIGFLYLRYAAEPATLYSWFEPYLHDEESVQIRQGKRETTVGKFVQLLLEDMDYYGTRLPRLPLAIERQLKVKLLMAEKVEERAKRNLENKPAMEYYQKIGSRVQALYGDDENPVTWYDAVVDAVIMRDKEGEMLPRPKFQVRFPEYGNTELVTLGEIDLPGTNNNNARPQERYDDKDRGYGRDDDRGRGYGHHGRRDDRGRGHDEHRGRGYHDERGRGCSDERGRGNDNYRSSPDRRRERSRSRDRFDNKHDARREEKELMDEVLRRERDKTAAKGKSYATRPTSFKDSLGTPGMQRHDTNPKSRGYDDSKTKAARDVAKGDCKPAAKASPPSTEKTKTAAELAAIQEKKRMLMSKYG